MHAGKGPSFRGNGISPVVSHERKPYRYRGGDRLASPQEITAAIRAELAARGRTPPEDEQPEVTP